MDKINLELEDLKKRLEELKPIMSRAYDTKEAFEQDEEMQEVAREYGQLQKRISELTWSIMDARQRKEKRLEKIAFCEKYFAHKDEGKHGDLGGRQGNFIRGLLAA